MRATAQEKAPVAATFNFVVEHKKDDVPRPRPTPGPQNNVFGADSIEQKKAETPPRPRPKPGPKDGGEDE